MKIVPKIVLSVVCWTSLVLMAQSYQRLQREIALLEGDLYKECQLIGALVAPELGALWRAQGPQAVIERADALLHDRWDVSLRPIALDAQAATPRAPLVAPAQLEEAMLRPVRVDHVEPPRIVTYVLLPEVAPNAALEIAASIAAERRFIDQAVFDLLLMLLMIALISLVFSAWAGWSVIGKRIARLSALARATARGDTTQLPIGAPRDELDALGLEFNLMSAALHDSHARAEQESLRREALSAQLLHADRLATVGSLLSQIAHEIGTPLAVVRGRLTRASGQLPQDTPAQRELGIATEQVDRVSAIIRGMLDYARGASTPGASSAHDLVTRAVELVEALAAREDVRFEVHHDTSPTLTVRGDLLTLEQALVNVLINAAHASSPGQAVAVSTTSIMAEEGQPLLQIAVWDQGQGVPEALREQIFEPFFSTKPAGVGTGMGLMIAASILRDHQGALTLDADATPGARFVLTLPAQEAP